MDISQNDSPEISSKSSLLLISFNVLSHRAHMVSLSENAGSQEQHVCAFSLGSILFYVL